MHHGSKQEWDNMIHPRLQDNMIHPSLQALNKVTFCNVGIKPSVDEFVKALWVG